MFWCAFGPIVTPLLFAIHRLKKQSKKKKQQETMRFLLARATWRHAILFSWAYVDFHGHIGIHQFRRRVRARLTPSLTSGSLDSAWADFAAY